MYTGNICRIINRYIVIYVQRYFVSYKKRVTSNCLKTKHENVLTKTGNVFCCNYFDTERTEKKKEITGNVLKQ